MATKPLKGVSGLPKGRAAYEKTLQYDVLNEIEVNLKDAISAFSL
ncbi:MAG: hypothetical protein U0Z75_01770 [Deinococcaceae bacterium]